jgi:hypothetical protein
VDSFSAGFAGAEGAPSSLMISSKPAFAIASQLTLAGIIVQSFEQWGKLTEVLPPPVMSISLISNRNQRHTCASGSTLRHDYNLTN